MRLNSIAVERLELSERHHFCIGRSWSSPTCSHAVDWETVFFELGKIFLSTGYYCHVLDLRELARLVAHCKGRPVILEGLLLERGKKMLENRTAFVRFHFVGGKY